MVSEESFVNEFLSQWVEDSVEKSINEFVEG
jgi:hypothetical protein